MALACRCGGRRRGDEGHTGGEGRTGTATKRRRGGGGGEEEEEEGRAEPAAGAKGGEGGGAHGRREVEGARVRQ